MSEPYLYVMQPNVHKFTICHIITGLNTGGAETALCRLIESTPLGVAHTVVGLGPRGSLTDRVAARATLHYLDMRAGRLMPANVLRLRRLIRNSRPDVVHGWMYHANFMLQLACLGLRVPKIWGIRHSLHSLDSEKRSTQWMIRLGAWLSCCADQIVYNSQVSCDQHTDFGFYGAKAKVIPNGFDTSVFKPDTDLRARFRDEFAIAQDTLAIGLVSRVHPMKDHANFLRAAARFVVGNPNALFVLVGDGAVKENTELSELIGTLKLRDNMRLCGRRGDVVAVNNALDIASSSSSWGEAFPNAIGEAMACGTPCVATEVGDVPDILGNTGVVVPPRDCAALCNGWMRLVKIGPDGRRSLGQLARERIIERYSLQSNVQAYMSLYNTLTKNI